MAGRLAGATAATHASASFTVRWREKKASRERPTSGVPPGILVRVMGTVLTATLVTTLFVELERDGGLDIASRSTPSVDDHTSNARAQPSAQHARFFCESALIFRGKGLLVRSCTRARRERRGGEVSRTHLCLQRFRRPCSASDPLHAGY